VRLLPPPRDEALRQAVRGVRDLIRGREPLTSVQGRQLALAQERVHLERGRALLQAGDPSGARAEADAIAGIRSGGKAAVALRDARIWSPPPSCCGRGAWTAR
jgi:hypothetical protein